MNADSDSNLRIRGQPHPPWEIPKPRGGTIPRWPQSHGAMLSLLPPRRAASWGVLILAFLVCSAGPIRAEESPAAERADEIEDVTVLPELEVKGNRVEEFGFRFNVTIRIPGTDTITVSEVWPNTAASKAGLRPGDVILKVDGKTASALRMGLRPNKLQERKWAELAAGKPTATLLLEVRAPDTKERRTLTLTIPSPAPRWGAMPWSAPEGRMPAVVSETGPLATLARDVLDHGICSMGGMYSVDGRTVVPLGYEWRIVQPSGMHRICVTQHKGKTEITLGHRSALTGDCWFLTSPAGTMDEGGGMTPKRKKEKRRSLTDEEVRARFSAELDFWLHHVGRVTGRWPFEAIPRNADATTSTGTDAAAATEVQAMRAEAFLQLPSATAEQRTLFLDALARVGLDSEGWAYTETSRGLDDVGTTTVRIDPSLPPAESPTLLKVNGKNPKKHDLEKWRTEGRAALPGLGEFPPLSSLVDVSDVRVVAEEAAAVVFELPLLASNAEFPAEKFQARFRVNKTHRGFEDFAVKLREKLTVGGVATVTDAGLEARFRVLDPKLAPQPVHLRLGGGMRVLLVKLSRSFEVTRTEFQRVVPLDAPPAKPAE